MAKMIPDYLPASVESAAERRCFEAMRGGLDETFTVLHDVAWLGRGRFEGAQGQCDFLLLHPTHGVLVIEVKGGGPWRDEQGQWFSRDTDGDHAIDDPYAQANRSKFALRDYVRGAGNAVAANACWGHAVWFSDARAPGDCGPESNPAITLDHAALFEVQAGIDRAFGYWSRDAGRPMGAEGVTRVVQALGRPLTLKIPLAVAIEDEAIEELRLTEEQYRFLGAIERQRRVVISGPAGSGKTMLALEQCRRFSAAGLRTLYVCFNLRLAKWASRQLAGLPGVTANAFHDLVDELAKAAGVPLPAVKDRDADYWDRRAPEVLFDVAASSGPAFDALVIDEAQDFHDWWLTALEALLVEHGRETIFLDSNQQIFERSARASLLDDSLRLTVNCRTTRAIQRALAPYQTGDVTDCTGPEGREPKHVAVSSDIKEEREVKRELFHLVTESGIALNRIVILTPRHETSHWKQGKVLGNFSLTWNDERDERKQVLCASIQAFKGMESDVIFLTEMTKLHAGQERQMWYTALSRARHHVVIFDMGDRAKNEP